MSSLDSEQIVTSLLAAAQLTVSDEEKATFIKDYPLIRKAADDLYLPELEFVEPATEFNPLKYYA